MRDSVRISYLSYPIVCNARAINPQAPIVQKVADEVVFRRFQGEAVEFFKSDLTDPLRLLMRIFWKIPILALQAFIYQWVFTSRSCFEADDFIAYSNE